MKLYIKSSSDARYLYIFKHGIGPGTIPSDVQIVKTKDLPNGYTAVWLDRFLTADELKQYDIPSETRINELLGRIDYCQKNGDVVPCDEVTASSNIPSYNKYADALANHGYSKRKFIQALKEEYTEQGLKDLLDNEADLHAYITGFILNSDGRYDYKAQEKASKLASEIISEADNIDACDEVTASVDMPFSKKAKQYAQAAWNKGMTVNKAYDFVFKSMTNDGYSTDYENASITIQKAVDQLYEEEGDPNDPSTWVGACDITATADIGVDIGADLPTSREFATTEWEVLNDGSKRLKLKDIFVYFANMVSASIDDSDYDDKFLVEGYYDNQRQSLAESAETSDVSYLNELINEYANKGYYIAVHNLTDGTITEFSADNWFDDLARDGGAMLFMS